MKERSLALCLAWRQMHELNKYYLWRADILFWIFSFAYTLYLHLKRFCFAYFFQWKSDYITQFGRPTSSQILCRFDFWWLVMVCMVLAKMLHRQMCVFLLSLPKFILYHLCNIIGNVDQTFPSYHNLHFFEERSCNKKKHLIILCNARHVAEI